MRNAMSARPSARLMPIQMMIAIVIHMMKAHEPMCRATLSDRRPNRSVSTDGRSERLRSGLAIGGILVTGILSTYVYATKGYFAVSNYRQIHANGRKAIDYFARDIRGVSTISTLSTNSSTKTLAVVIPIAFNSSGTPFIGVALPTKSTRSGRSGVNRSG